MVRVTCRCGARTLLFHHLKQGEITTFACRDCPKEIVEIKEKLKEVPQKPKKTVKKSKKLKGE
jgi:hypothetical protein